MKATLAIAVKNVIMFCLFYRLYLYNNKHIHFLIKTFLKQDDACRNNNLCQNRAKCLTDGHTYKCDCLNNGFTGKHCENCKEII